MKGEMMKLWFVLVSTWSTSQFYTSLLALELEPLNFMVLHGPCLNDCRHFGILVGSGSGQLQLSAAPIGSNDVWDDNVQISGLMQPASTQNWLSSQSSSSGLIVKRTIRVDIPIDQYPNYNFVGRLLGPRGNSLKRVEASTECRVLIRGRGSIKDPGREEIMRGKPGYEHLNEPLHILVEAELPVEIVDARLMQAREILEDLLKPVATTTCNSPQLFDDIFTLKKPFPSWTKHLKDVMKGEMMKLWFVLLSIGLAFIIAHLVLFLGGQLEWRFWLNPIGNINFHGKQCSLTCSARKVLPCLVLFFLPDTSLGLKRSKMKRNCPSPETSKIFSVSANAFNFHEGTGTSLPCLYMKYVKLSSVCTRFSDDVL
ncbi:hypothetical protein JRO89_XS03G0333600 [Xanthoceras sorbifolium]|uniref:K Homology domain-containing protein n=1 Tax=Xanthoceras sorbifolium TaxID=99658 RepID=A0ABQ8IDN2_9ROSI|nr:hypothetical protein JRO89_XS03G0333600 [Xanthoceras sorbifolium]